MKLDPKLFSGGVNVSKFTAQIVEQFTADASPGAVLSLIDFLIEVNRQNAEVVFRWALVKKVNAAQVGLDVASFREQLADMRGVTLGALAGRVAPEFFGSRVVGPLIFGNYPDGQKRVPLASAVVSVANQIGAVNLHVEKAFGELVSDLTFGLVGGADDPDAWSFQEKALAAGVATIAGVGLFALLVYAIGRD